MQVLSAVNLAVLMTVYLTACGNSETDNPIGPEPIEPQPSGGASTGAAPATGGTLTGASGLSVSATGGGGTLPKASEGAGGSGELDPSDCSDALLSQEGLLLHLDAGTLTESTVTHWANQGTAGGAFTPGLAPQLVHDALMGMPAVRFDGSQNLTSSVPINGLLNFTLALVSATRALQKPGAEWCQNDFSVDITENGCSGTYNLPIMWKDTGDWGYAYLGPMQEQVAFRFGPGGKTYSPNLGSIAHDPNVGWKRPESIGNAPTATIAVKTETRLRLYVEGALVYDADIPGGAGPITNVSDEVELGSGRRADLRWIGDIAEIAAYGRALDETEVAELDQYLACKYFPDRE